jgi:hypothetical protein
MIKEYLAALLDGIQYPAHGSIAKDQIEAAKAAGLVIVFGASDDLMELEGAIRDEFGCYDGGTALIDAIGLLPDRENIEDDDELKAYFKRKPLARRIEALWCKEDGYSWTYSTDIPHATFDVLDGEDHYCRGIVFALAELVPQVAP